MGFNEDLKRQWNDACLSAGLSAISTDKAARILAMVYVLGGSHSSYTYSTLLRADLDYIKKRFHIGGAETPDAEIIPLIRKYSEELETEWAKAECSWKYTEWIPDWAAELAKQYQLYKNL